MKTQASAPGATQTRGINPALAAIAILMMALIGTTQAVTLDTGTAKKANAATPEGPAYIASDHVGLVMPDTPVATFTLSAGNQNAVADRTEHVYGKTDNTPVAANFGTPQTAGFNATPPTNTTASFGGTGQHADANPNAATNQPGFAKTTEEAFHGLTGVDTGGSF